MAPFDKPTISEVEAVRRFVFAILTGVRDNWSAVTDEFRPFLMGGKFFEGEGGEARPEDFDSAWAQYEFALACIAVQMQALPNLLPIEQARRIRACVFAGLVLLSDTPDLAKATVEAIEAYERAWSQASAAVEPPWGEIASVLFDRLHLSAFVTLGGVKLKPPLLLTAMGQTVLTFGGPWWKTFLSKYQLVPASSSRNS